LARFIKHLPYPKGSPLNPTPLPASFDLSYVALSFLISTVGAFVALTAAAGIAGRNRPLNRVNLFAAGLALGGIGIWAMHFIGMLAMEVDMGVGYAVTETLVSLAFAVVGCTIALSWVARHPGSVRHLLQGGLVLGLAVCVMHYLGMYGMRFGGFFEWSGTLVGASVAIALVAATAALFLAFSVRGLPARALAAAVMGVAVCAMHYTGMAAASFICTSATPALVPPGFGVVAARDLPVLVAVLALGMAFVISVDQVFQRLGAAPARPVRRRA
jgi:NO-binding membrane sensor protein with MHYT domain